MKGLLFTGKQVEGLFPSFCCRIQGVSWLVKLEGELDTAVFFAFFVKLILAIAATEMGQIHISHQMSSLESGLTSDKLSLTEKNAIWVVCYQQVPEYTYIFSAEKTISTNHLYLFILKYFS